MGYFDLHHVITCQECDGEATAHARNKFLKSLQILKYELRGGHGRGWGGGGGSEHRNTAKKINGHRITARKVNETPSPQHVLLAQRLVYRRLK